MKSIMAMELNDFVHHHTVNYSISLHRQSCWCELIELNIMLKLAAADVTYLHQQLPMCSTVANKQTA